MRFLLASLKIFNVSSNETVYLYRSMFNRSMIEDILCIRTGKLLQKYCSLDNIVRALCRRLRLHHWMHRELGYLTLLVNIFIVIIVLPVFGERKFCV